MNELSTIYSYGGGEVLFYIFNAIAMLFNGGFVKSIFEFVVVLALIWAGLKSAITRDHHKVYVRWFMSFVVVWLLIIQPIGSGKTLHIRDVVTNKGKHVNNLPPSLVIPASIISGIGYNITKNFETVFKTPSGAQNYLEYHKYGTMFGAQVISEFRNFKIQDPVFRENMEEYISSCMMYDVMIGKSYDIQELKSSNNVIKLITDNASTLRMVNYRNASHQGKELVSCKAAITKIVQSFDGEPNLLSKKFPVFSNIQTSNLGGNNKLGTGIVKALELSTKFYGNMGAGSAQDKLKQILIINAFKDKPDSYGTLRAAQNQNTAWTFTGEMAKQTLPIMHALFEALIYALFPIAICMLFFPGGYKAIGNYFGMLIWIQLWPPLFAVLNLIVSVFAKMSNSTGEITIQSLENIVSSQSNYAMAASSLGMLIPVLSYMIMKGGAGQFVHIASQLSGATNAGVSTATHEVASGNRSLDNINIGDKSLHNTRANKYDTSGLVESGYIRQRHSTGEYQTDLASGDTVFQAGAGITKSTGSMNIQALKASGDSYRTLSQQYRSISESASNELGETTQAMTRQSVDFVARLADSQARGASHELSDATSDSKMLQHFINKTKELKEDYGYSWQQASEKAMSGNLGVRGAINKSFDEKKGGIGGLIAKVIGGDASIGGSIEGNISTRGSFSNTDTQNLNETDVSLSKEDHANTVESIARASKNMSFNENQSKEKALAENLGKLYEKSVQHRETIAENDTKAEQAQRNYEKIHSFTSSVGRDEYQDVLDYIANKFDPVFEGYRIGHHKAQRVLENNPEQSMKYIEEWQDRNAEQRKMSYPSHVQKDIDVLENKEKDLMKDYKGVTLGKVKNEAQSKVKDTTLQFKEQITEDHFKNVRVDGDDIKSEYQKRNSTTDKKLEEQKMNIIKESKRIEMEVDKAESNKGLIAKTFGVGRKNPNRGNK